MTLLRQFIEGSGMPRSRWQHRFGISRPYLHQLEAGQKTPSLDLAVRIERETDGAVPAASWVEPVPSADAEGRAA